MPLFTMQKRKKFEFKVSVTLHELELIPFTSIIFAKVKLNNSNNSFSLTTSKHQVKNHTVIWNQNMTLLCIFLADTNGYLLPCMCKISIRRELKGGKSHEELGFVKVNLSQFAGSGSILQHFLLQSSSKRSVNSILKLSIDMVQKSGDSCYKVFRPTPQSLSQLLENSDLYNISINEVSCFCAPFLHDSLQHTQGINGIPLMNANSFYVDSQDNEYDNNHNESSSTFEFVSFNHSDLEENRLQLFDNLKPTSASLPQNISLATDKAFNMYTKRLSTIDCVTHRISSSRVNAQNAVDELLHMKPLHSTSNNGTKSILTLNKKGNLEVKDTCLTTLF